MPSPLSARACQRMIELSKYQVKVNTGSWYPCTQRDIDDYESFTSIRWQDSNWSMDDALFNLTQALCGRPSRRTKEALDHLYHAVCDPACGPDTIIKAFHDIDLTLFGKTLRGRVIVRWTTEAFLRRRGRGPVYGVTMHKSKGRSTIYLNTDRIFDGNHSKDQMWRVVIHEAVVSQGIFATDLIVTQN